MQVFINFRSAISAMCELDEREPHRCSLRAQALSRLEPFLPKPTPAYSDLRQT